MSTIHFWAESVGHFLVILTNSAAGELCVHIADDDVISAASRMVSCEEELEVVASGDIRYEYDA